MPWGVAVAAVVGAYSANQQKKGAQGAANAQAKANDAAIAEQRRQYDQTRQDMLPFLQGGYDAINRQKQFLAGDWSGFKDSPDYAFSFSEGLKALDRGAASRGALYSGGADADRIRFGQGLASQNVNNYWNRLAGMANQGQVTGQGLGSFGQGAANSIASLLNNTGNARASSYMARADANSQLAAGIGNAFGSYYGDGWGGV